MANLATAVRIAELEVENLRLRVAVELAIARLARARTTGQPPVDLAALEDELRLAFPMQADEHGGVSSTPSIPQNCVSGGSDVRRA